VKTTAQPRRKNRRYSNVGMKKTGDAGGGKNKLLMNCKELGRDRVENYPSITNIWKC